MSDPFDAGFLMSIGIIAPGSFFSERMISVL
jgi:hypothetical protein